MPWQPGDRRGNHSGCSDRADRTGAGAQSGSDRRHQHRGLAAVPGHHRRNRPDRRGDPHWASTAIRRWAPTDCRPRRRSLGTEADIPAQVLGTCWQRCRPTGGRGSRRSAWPTLTPPRHRAPTCTSSAGPHHSSMDASALCTGWRSHLSSTPWTPTSHCLGRCLGKNRRSSSPMPCTPPGSPSLPAATWVGRDTTSTATKWVAWRQTKQGDGHVCIFGGVRFDAWRVGARCGGASGQYADRCFECRCVRVAARRWPHRAPDGEWTRGITVGTGPEQVWPWLAQMGYGRGAWYTP
jgi:hypothetical protein